VTNEDTGKVYDLANVAAQIAALSHYLAQALFDDPSNARVGEAVEGLSDMATRLSNDLIALGDPNA
jgi:hypothetical protein